LYVPEADFELLIRKLSDALSRATELAASIGARLGMEHRLAELASAASWRIENMLREVRTFATANLNTAGGLTELQDALQTDTLPVTPAPANPSQRNLTGVQAMSSFAAQAGLESEHWLAMFVEDLTSQLRASDGITFEVAERLLQQRKDAFLRDFLVARRMYRAYPHLFPEIQGGMGRAPGRSI
jgi:guanyl-specific ribonuclease Sa